MTSTQKYSESVSGIRSATEKAGDLWKQSAQRLASQAEVAAKLPELDMPQLVERNFQYVQRVVEINWDYARKSAARFTTLTDILREPMGSLAPMIQAHADALADLLSSEADMVEQVARRRADVIDDAKREQSHRR